MLQAGQLQCFTSRVKLRFTLHDGIDRLFRNACNNLRCVTSQKSKDVIALVIVLMRMTHIWSVFRLSQRFS